MVRLSLTSSATNHRKGFVLLELCLALALAALLAVQLQRTILPLLKSWQLLQQQNQLYEAKDYMFSQLEYELGQNTSLITLDQGRTQLNCQSLRQQRQLTFGRELVNNHYGLYMTIRNNKGSSKQPLFLTDCQLNAWWLEALDEKHLRIELELSHGKRQQRFCRVLTLINGRIIHE